MGWKGVAVAKRLARQSQYKWQGVCHLRTRARGPASGERTLLGDHMEKVFMCYGRVKGWVCTGRYGEESRKLQWEVV